MNSHEAVFLFPFVSSSPRRATDDPRNLLDGRKNMEQDGKEGFMGKGQANKGFYAKQGTGRSLGEREINKKEKEELG